MKNKLFTNTPHGLRPNPSWEMVDEGLAEFEIGQWGGTAEAKKLTDDAVVKRALTLWTFMGYGTTLPLNAP